MIFNNRIKIFLALFSIATISHAARILVDIDGAIADFDQQAEDKYKQTYPNEPFLPLKERTEVDIIKHFATLSTAQEKAIKDVLAQEDFCKTIPLIDGAKDALNEMTEQGHSVFLVTQTLPENPTCAQDRFEWVKENLGDEWTSRLIITTDKTIIKADILIDDEPTITGEEDPPSWKQILFHHAYNAYEDIPRFKKWQNWEKVVKENLPAEKP